MPGPLAQFAGTVQILSKPIPCLEISLKMGSISNMRLASMPLFPKRAAAQKMIENKNSYLG